MERMNTHTQKMRKEIYLKVSLPTIGRIDT